MGWRVVVVGGGGGSASITSCQCGVMEEVLSVFNENIECSSWQSLAIFY